MSLYLACFFALVSTTAGEDWPQFRGPEGNGVAAAADPPLKWSDDKNIARKTPLPGCGRSSPVLLGDRIWLTFAVAQNVKRARIGPDDSQVADQVTFGKTTVLKAGKEFLRLAENSLEGPLVATPAMAGRAIFLRSDSHLYRLESQSAE